MGNMYERILALCDARGIKPGRVCADTGLSRGMMSDLKMGRTKELSAKNTKIIADYFEVSTDYLLGTEAEKTPAPEDERETSDQDIPDENFIILSRNAKKLSPEKRKQLLDMAKIMFKEEFND